MAGQTVQVWGLAILVIFTKSGVSGRVDERERVGGGIALSRFVLMRFAGQISTNIFQQILTQISSILKKWKILLGAAIHFN